MGLLAGKTILLAGGTNPVGEGIVQVLLENGAVVIIPSLSEEKLCELRIKNSNNKRLYTPLANMLTMAGANELSGWIIMEFRKLDVVISCCSEWWQGAPLLDISLDTWHKFMEKGITAQFILAKIFLPLLLKNQGSCYLLISNTAGQKPVAFAALAAVSGAGEIMLKDVLSLEKKDNPVRINTLLIDAGQFATRQQEVPRISILDIAHYCLFLLSAQAAHIDGQTLVFTEKSQLSDLTNRNADHIQQAG